MSVPSPEDLVTEVERETVVETVPQLDVVEIDTGVIGPQGPPGPPGTAGARRFHGEGPPFAVIGAQLGDEYLDTLTGELYYLT